MFILHLCPGPMTNLHITFRIDGVCRLTSGCRLTLGYTNMRGLLTKTEILVA